MLVELAELLLFNALVDSVSLTPEADSESDFAVLVFSLIAVERLSCNL